MAGTIRLGMSREELRTLAGPPVSVREAPLGGVEVWRYREFGQRRWWLRTRWIDFQFRDGRLSDDVRSIDSYQAVAMQYGRRAAIAAGVLGIGLLSLVATDRRHGERLRTAREALRPGMTAAEVGELFGADPPSRTQHNASWVVEARSVDQLVPGWYLIDGRFTRTSSPPKANVEIEFRNGEVVEWRDEVTR